MDLATLPVAVAADMAQLQSPESQALLRVLEARLAQVPQIQALETRLDQVVPGWRTSEFWMTNIATLGLVLASIGGVLPAKYAVIAAGLSQAAYSISRGITKSGTGK